VAAVTTLLALGLLALFAAGALIGWRLARRRNAAVEAELRTELETARTRLDQQRQAHDAVVRETMSTALGAIRRLGGA